MSGIPARFECPGTFGWLVLAVGCLAGTPAFADCTGTAAESGRVAEIIDGDTLILDSGLQVRLAGVEAPKRLPGQASEGGKSAELARAALGSLAKGVAVTLHYGADRRDRYGRAIALVQMANGRLLQELMLDQGLVRVHGPVAEDCLTPFLAAEQRARAGAKGMWNEPQFAVRDADDASLQTQKGLYVVVEGRVASVGHGTRVVFLNFGRDWRRDFTVTIATAVARLVEDGEASLDSLAGKRVRVRGIVEQNGGPLIRVNERSGIEVLGDD